MLEVADIERQVGSLNHAAVGPGGLVERQTTPRDQAATHVVEGQPGDIQCAGPNMQNAAVEVLEAASGEAQVSVGGLKCATGVIQQASNGEAAVTCKPKGANLPVGVVQTGRADIQG